VGEGHLADMPQAQSGEERVEFLKAMKSAFPDMRIRPQLVIVSGPNVLAVELITGTHEGTMQLPGAPDLRATHRKIGTLSFQRLAFSDGKAEEWTCNDPRTLSGQLGQLPERAGPTRPVLGTGWKGAPFVLVSTDDAKEKANIDIAKKTVDAINAHKVEDVVATVTNDVLVSDQADPQDGKGKKAYQKSLERFFTAFPDVKLEGGYWAAGDWVVWIGKMTGTWKGALGSLRPTGKPVSSEYAQVMKVKDGKAAEIWRFRNGLGAGR